MTFGAYLFSIRF